MRIGIVAGEASGDLLGAGLVEALRARHPSAEFRGIPGPLMRAAGVDAVFDADELSVMGLFEVLGRLPRLLQVRRELIADMNAWQPDVFIGIDSPDFTLPVERRLRDAGIRTVHYVSPTVWAWRPGRVKIVERAASAVLCLFPFEPIHYAGVEVKATFVGHPLATSLVAPDDGMMLARERLGLATDDVVVAVLPGSRGSEMRHLGRAMAGAMQRLSARKVHFVTPMVTPALEVAFRELCDRHAPDADIAFLKGEAHSAMLAADVVLAASGTATLEAMLLGRPMVAAYRLAPLTAWFLRTFRMLRIERYALPNLLAGDALVPELIQESATPERMEEAISELLDNPDARRRQLDAFTRLRACLQGGGHEAAADAVIEAMS